MNKSNQQERIVAILQTLQDVERSPLSVSQYFQETATPFGRTQYYHYKKAIKERGIQGLTDQRSQGNHVKFRDEMKGFVKGLLASDRTMTSSEVQDALKHEFGLTISLRVIHDFRRETALRRSLKFVQETGGSELVIALALDSGIIKTITDSIYQHVQTIKGSAQFKESGSTPKDAPELRAQGKFTSAYNGSVQVRASRFLSLEEKLRTKRFVSMGIFSRSQETLMRYTLALFALPLVTANGRVRSVDHPRGNALQSLCGYNYRASTLTKHLNEMKYLQMSHRLIETTAKFWIAFWAETTKSETMFVCYYIDGNTKALWSSKPCHKGKVTMLGRVMNCLEQVFIHDGQGHPIYFQTFNGHVDLGKNALRMMDRLNEYMKATFRTDEACPVTRILIFDGGGNGVKTLRGLCQSEYHFITILDSNQVNERKLKSVSHEKRYEYGAAWLVDCAIELEDSHEKGYIFETRAVQVHWDNERLSVLVTSLPKEIFSPDHVVKSYFDRWPAQELTFKEMKSRVNLHRVVGYGKKSIDNPTVQEKIERLQMQIQELEHTLAGPLHDITELEKILHIRISEERIYREKSCVVNGKRTLSEDDALLLKKIQKDINGLNRKIKKIEQGASKLFTSLKKKRTELARIIDKKKIYRVDVELDQLMTCFKVSFANICCYLMEKCFKGEKMTLERLFDTIFELRGQMHVEKEQRNVCIERNPKQGDIMKKLEYAFEVINHMGIQDINGYKYHFKLV